VFDGALDRPYVETDEPRPLNAYGRSKAEAERQVLAAGGDALVVRTAAFFSPDDPYNFAAWIMRELKSGRAAHAAADCVITPTYVPHLAQAVLDLIVDGETGIRHLSSGQPMSWAEFGRFIARALDLDARLVRPTPSADLGWTAVRPRRAALGTRLGVVMPSFEEALGRYAMAVKGGLSAAEVEAEVRREALEEPVADGAASARRH
jgi:dTDP-4-dehydrorhamnose reductase